MYNEICDSFTAFEPCAFQAWTEKRGSCSRFHLCVFSVVHARYRVICCAFIVCLAEDVGLRRVLSQPEELDVLVCGVLGWTLVWTSRSGRVDSQIIIMKEECVLLLLMASWPWKYLFSNEDIIVVLTSWRLTNRRWKRWTENRKQRFARPAAAAADSGYA